MRPLLRAFLFLLLGLLILAATLSINFLFYLQTPVTPQPAVTVTVAPGTPFGLVAKQLVQAGAIQHPTRFKLLARWRGQASAVHAGSYRFERPATPDEVLRRLVTGDVLLVTLTIPEGMSLTEIAQRVEQSGSGKAETFLQLARDPELLAKLGIVAASAEGYLFPETYRFVPETREPELLHIMVAEGRRRLTPEMGARLKELGWTLHQALTLASIVQKEAGNEEEMPLIAAVFHNRLRLGMRLQTDPTVIYGIEGYAGNITRHHLETDTPYNTYTRGGLPPGPIASPGEAALRAALWPATANYLYFVSRQDGTHHFSRSLVEHNEAVRRYQLRR